MGQTTGACGERAQVPHGRGPPLLQGCGLASQLSYEGCPDPGPSSVVYDSS